MTENNTHPRFLVTGDVHGSYDIHKLSAHSFKYNDFDPPLTKEDYLVICGDFGLVWDWCGENKEERYWLDWLEEKPWTTLFVDGNHECFPRLNEFPVEQWNGGKIHRISDSIFHLMRGQVFNIDGTTLFVCGGANSHDTQYRTEGKSWWSQEIPSFCEREEALANLAANDWKVDYVITHDTPTDIARMILHGWEIYDRPLNEYTDWLQEIADKLEFKQWFFGHYHQDKELLDGKYQAMYYDIVMLED